jgi:hypothetical protein
VVVREGGEGRGGETTRGERECGLGAGCCRAPIGQAPPGPADQPLTPPLSLSSWPLGYQLQ